MNPPATRGTRIKATAVAERRVRRDIRARVTKGSYYSRITYLLAGDGGVPESACAPFVASSVPCSQKYFQDITRPFRKPFWVNFTPSGEIATVYGCPSMSSSRLIVLSNLVAIGLLRLG